MRKLIVAAMLLSTLSGCAYTSITVNVTANPVVKHNGDFILNSPE